MIQKEQGENLPVGDSIPQNPAQLGRLELPSLSAYAPEAYVYTNFTTSVQITQVILAKRRRKNNFYWGKRKIFEKVKPELQSMGITVALAESLLLADAQGISRQNKENLPLLKLVEKLYHQGLK